MRVEDREIVHREIPDHVHVALEQAEIDAGGIVIEDPSELAVRRHVGDLAHRVGVDERMVGQDLPPDLRRQLDQPRRFVGRAAQRLFHHHMLAGLERGFRQREMGRDRGRDGDHVDAGVGDQLARIGMHDDVGIEAGGARPALLVAVGDRHQLGPFGLVEDAREVGSPIAVADDTVFQHGQCALCRRSALARDDDTVSKSCSVISSNMGRMRPRSCAFSDTGSGKRTPVASSPRE